MKVGNAIRLVIFVMIICCLLFLTSFFADWAYKFVVYDGYTYVISDELVIEIDKEIGEVTKYSDREGTYYGNFSNTYKKGTKYYSIKGISTDEAIAVEDDGKYIKAIRNSKYPGGKYNPFNIVIGGVVIVIVFTTLLIVVRKINRN